ncbi:preprotein translocase subunit SecE [Acetobacteraceae bacterium H6797]|nr:preprotein translocase subunit SecE [Acetobacteraceae bacterium H6797]
MEDHRNQIEFGAVKAEDIMPERLAFWHSFTRATIFTIVATALLLVFIKLITG